MIPVIYIAGKYTDTTPERIQANVDKAIQAGVDIRAFGGCPVIPHLTHYVVPFVGEELRCNSDYWLEWDLPILAKCDAIYMLPNWTESKGAIKEHQFATDNLIPVLLSMDDVGLFIEAWND